MVGASDTYADCPREVATMPKVASNAPKIPENRRVYFMPEKSKFFTLNHVPRHFQRLSCTQDAEIGLSDSAIWLTLGALPPKCQVTKGAHTLGGVAKFRRF